MGLPLAEAVLDCRPRAQVYRGRATMQGKQAVGTGRARPREPGGTFSIDQGGRDTAAGAAPPHSSAENTCI